MKVFRSLDDIHDIKDTVVALGNFDGIHVGHQELIRRAVKSAKITGMKSADSATRKTWWPAKGSSKTSCTTTKRWK